VQKGQQMCELSTDGPLVIVAGIDGSDSSMRAAAYAFGLGRRQGATVVFGYIRPLGTGTPTVAGAMSEAGLDIAADLEKEIRDGAQRLPDDHRARWEFRVGQGDAFHGLVELADRLKADAVVIGASQKAGHRVLGSVAIRLVKAGRWPVTVVP
jgi:nucleotide-binding universal stress UspA family protein